jgi:hypothetical protein
VGSVSLSSLSLTATYRYYTRSSIQTATEYHALPVLPVAATQPGAAEGRELLSQAMSLQAAAAAQPFTASSLPDFSCSKQWSLSLNLLLPAAALAKPGGSSTRLTPLLSVLADASAAGGRGASWPHVALSVSPSGPALAVTWGPSAVRQQAVTISPNRDGWASVHLAVVRDGSRLGVWLDSNGTWLLDDVWCVPANMGVNYCTQPGDATADSSFKALRLGGTDGSSSSADISITSARVYNYALPRLSLAAESGCADDGSCGRFLVSGWAPPPSSSIPAGSVSGAAVSAVTSTPIPLRATSYYLMVGAPTWAWCSRLMGAERSPCTVYACAGPPLMWHCFALSVRLCVCVQVGAWGPCSAPCGGGWSTRAVRCMRLGSSTSSPTVEVPLEECPLGEWGSKDSTCSCMSEAPSCCAPACRKPAQGLLPLLHALCPCLFAGESAPASSRRCNTVSCPRATFQLLAGQHSACRAGQGCKLLPSASDGAQLACINSLG